MLSHPRNFDMNIWQLLVTGDMYRCYKLFGSLQYITKSELITTLIDTPSVEEADDFKVY